MPTTLSFTHTLPPQLTHYFSGDLGTLSLGIPYHTCNATTVAKETTVFFVRFFFPKPDFTLDPHITTLDYRQKGRKTPSPARLSSQQHGQQVTYLVLLCSAL